MLIDKKLTDIFFKLFLKANYNKISSTGAIGILGFMRNISVHNNSCATFYFSDKFFIMFIFVSQITFFNFII